ncbi:MAG: aminomethyl-transferring glycine dehydrogenase subunit GcvPA [Acholeplasmataceae bacterium]|nr:aminomethyl-transferring glycine dehydrogenase subunit GcvPA [Acholeplasmataceae bacterium]
MAKDLVHPYMPNSVPAIKKEMLAELGVKSIKEIYESIIPKDLLYKKRLDLPEAIRSESELKKHVMGLLNENITTEEYTSFLGAGCYKHQIPAICDELNARGEFLTAYCGDTYSDHGKMQAIFEYASMLGEMLDVDVVSYTMYDAGQAVTSALSTALRVKEAAGRPKNKVLVPATMDPEIYSQACEYLRHKATIVKVAYDRETGLMDLRDLKKKLKGRDVAAVFYENPSYLGFFETNASLIAKLAHERDALAIARPEVAALGIMESPANLGADILCGDIQPLGMHIQFGGGQSGFMACRQDIKLVEQFPTYMYGITKTANKGEFGWGRAMNQRCSHGSRENAKEYFGTETGLWGITAGIYLASMGPQGMYELGETIIQNQAYLKKILNNVPGVKAGVFTTGGFQEVLVNFDKTGKTAREINKALLKAKIFGGKSMKEAFPELGESALYCVSELTTEEDMENLAMALKKIVGVC